METSNMHGGESRSSQSSERKNFVVLKWGKVWVQTLDPDGDVSFRIHRFPNEKRPDYNNFWTHKMLRLVQFNFLLISNSGCEKV